MIKTFSSRVKFFFERNPRRTLNLRNNNTLITVNNKRACIRHKRKITEIYLLLLDINRRDQTQLHLQGSSIIHTATLTFRSGIFLFAEHIAHVFQLDLSIIAFKRKHFAENFFQPLVIALFRQHITLQKILIGYRLDIQQVR